MSPREPILRLGTNCSVIAAVDEAAALVDADIYYRAAHRAIAGAKRYVMVSGWQFDSSVEMLRGDAAASTEAPSQLLQLLTWACERNPELEVYVLAWDFSPVFLLEREWFQKRVFDSAGSKRIHFQWDSFFAAHASHHQKLLVVDGTIAFSGGMDICSSRWDTRAHEPENSLRHNGDGKPCKPYHDVQAFVRGPVVAPLQELFYDRWIQNGGDMKRLAPVDHPPPTLSELCDGALPLRLSSAAVSQTRVAPEGDKTPALLHIRKLYEDAIERAEALVYIEQQYFTSRAVLRSFMRRLTNGALPKLQIVVILPHGGDTPKERFALGEAQAFVLNGIRCAAEEHGHAFGAFTTGTRLPTGELKATFMHSKVLLVDDRFVSIGSANMTNRSLGLDTELNLSWEHEHAVDDITELRASLLAEHCGSSDSRRYLDIDGLVERLDADTFSTRLHRYIIDSADDCDPLLSLATDPVSPAGSGALDERIDEAWESFDSTWFKSGIERWLARHDKGDIPDDRR